MFEIRNKVDVIVMKEQGIGNLKYEIGILNQESVSRVPHPRDVFAFVARVGTNYISCSGAGAPPSARICFFA